MPGYPWKSREVTELRKLYKDRNLTAAQIGEKLGRTKGAVILKAMYLGLKRGWSHDDIEYLRKTYPDQSVPLHVISKKLGRSRTTVWEHATKLGLRRGDAHRIWTEDEMDYLRANYDKPIVILSKHLGRSHRSIQERARHLGLVNGKKVWHHDIRRYRDRKTALHEHGYRCMVDGCVGFESVVEVHHAPDGKLWVLCPGHHKLVTKHYATTIGDKYTILDY